MSAVAPTAPAAGDVTRDEQVAAVVKAMTPAQKKAIREAARRDVLAKEAERIAATRPAGGGPPTSTATPAGRAAPSSPASSPSSTPERTDAHRLKDAAAFLRGVLFPLLAFAAVFTPWRLDLDRFTEAAALDDAAAWVPLARRYALVDGLITWAGMPARLVSRVRALAVRRTASPAPPPTTPPITETTPDA